MSDADEANQGLKTHLSTDDYRILVSWMENPRNFAAIYGKAKKTTIDGDNKKITKLQAFREMAEYLHHQSKTANLPRLSAADMQQRWNTYKQRFGKIMESCEAGLSLSKEIVKCMSVPEKLELCHPHFARMRELFGAEVSAHATRPAKRTNTQVATTVENGDERGDSAIKNAENRAASTVESGMVTEDDAVVSSSDSSEQVRPQIPFPQAQATARRMQVNPTRKRKLEVSDRRLEEEEREERECERAFEREQRRLERKEPQATRNQKLLLALINQGKSVEEIREYLKLVGELQASSTPTPDEQA